MDVAYFKNIFIVIFFSLMCSLVYSAEERITITTYYPAPYGSYKTIKIEPSSPENVECNINNRGLIFYNKDNDLLFYCNGKTFLPLGCSRQNTNLKVNTLTAENIVAESAKIKKLFSEKEESSVIKTEKAEILSALNADNITAGNSKFKNIHSETITNEGNILTKNLFAEIKHLYYKYPSKPSSYIVYTSMESRLPIIVLAGQSEINNGEGILSLPEDFIVLTSAAYPYNVFLQPFGEGHLFVKNRSRNKIIIAADTNVSLKFGYLIIGVRKGMENFSTYRK